VLLRVCFLIFVFFFIFVRICTTKRVKEEEEEAEKQKNKKNNTSGEKLYVFNADSCMQRREQEKPLL